MESTQVLLGLVGLILGFVVSWFLGTRTAAAKITAAEQRAKSILEDAEKDAQAIKKEKLLEVKEEWHKKKQEFDEQSRAKKNKLQQHEKQLHTREESVGQKLELMMRKEKQVQSLESDLQRRAKEIEAAEESAKKLIEEQTLRLERITGMSRDDAKRFLMENLLQEAKNEAAQTVKDIRDEAKLNAKRDAQNIVVHAIQRTASDHSVETTISVVDLASEDMKGRIIGREGRNIRAFEAATGIDLIVDDTPEAVLISGFDPFRREVAKISLDRLLQDGRIHPARIEEVVSKVNKELEEEMIEVGRNTLFDMGIHNVHQDIIRLIGKMKYRSSYGQNLLAHSIEVAHLCAIMAAELGLDATMAKRAGLMHDMGKCVDKSIEGPHALIGYDIARKCKEHPIVANAIGAHHDEIEMESAIAVLVQAADSISGARPGARRESVENYIKRLEKLESLAQSFDGVTKTFAIQAGREVRVIVEPERVDDLLADTLSHDIAAAIQRDMEYPGQVRVVVIRERRSIAYAK